MPTKIDASFIDSLPANVAVQFLERVAKSPHREAFRYPEGDGWKSVTWKQAGDDVSKIAAGPAGARDPGRAAGRDRLRHALRVDPRRPRRSCAPARRRRRSTRRTNEEDTAYILSDSECQVVFAEDDTQIAKLTARRSELPNLRKVVTFDGDRPTATGSSAIEELEQARRRPTSPSTPGSSRRPPRASAATSSPR